MVIAIKEEDHVVIAVSLTDSIFGVADDDLINEENMPIKRINDNCFIACSRFGRESDLILYDDELFNSELNENIICKKIISTLKKKLKAENLINEKGKWNNSVVIAYKDKIWNITPNLYFKEIDDYVCSGYQTDSLLGALEATKVKSAKERIKLSVDIYNRVNNDLYYPMIITDNICDKKEIICK